MEDHSLIARGVPPPVAMRFYAALLKAPPKDLALAIEWVHDANMTLSLSDCVDSLRAFAEQSGRSIKNPRIILHSLFSLEGLRSALEWSPPDLLDFLAQTAAEEKLVKKSADQKGVQHALQQFFQNAPKLAQIAKAQKIYDGLLPNFDSCWSLVEFRPVFDPDRSRIESGIITASLSLRVRNDNSADEPFTNFAFQLDMADAQALIEELTRIKTKIRLVKEFEEQRGTRLMNPRTSLTEKKGDKR